MPAPPCSLPSLSCSVSVVHTPRRLHTPHSPSLCPFPVALSGNTCLTGINNSIKIYILLFNNLLLLFVNFALALSPSLSDLLLLLTYFPFRCRFSSYASWNSRKSVSAANPETIVAFNRQCLMTIYAVSAAWEPQTETET